jgi:hypothetical protein
MQSAPTNSICHRQNKRSARSGRRTRIAHELPDVSLKDFARLKPVKGNRSLQSNIISVLGFK